ncbi:amidohydrolase family protein [Agromyces silvae]|uniref:amidohydrolase family protein n=1 Tax=Agromyces silvae TaxID=3388266 RepID=UPI00280B03BA|nr:hypothetical protein [Agromyces protaetiae]
MRVFDCNRLLGALPSIPTAGSEDETLAQLDHLGIDGACVTPAWMLHGDPRTSAEFEAASGTSPSSSRLVRVSVVIPGSAAAGWPRHPEMLRGELAVRACPVRHRFDPLGRSALEWWSFLAEAEMPLLLDAGEIGLPLVARIAGAVPRLRIVVLAAGYRENARIGELASEHPNLFFETGTIIGAGAIEWLAGELGAHRMLFGTGAPEWDDAGPRFQLDRLMLSAGDVELIAGGSWERLVGGRQ